MPPAVLVPEAEEAASAAVEGWADKEAKAESEEAH
jgi:hypothetical protein